MPKKFENKFFNFLKFSVYPFCSATGHVKRNLKLIFLNFKNFQCTFFSPPLVMPKKFENKFFDFLKFSVYPFFSATGNVKRNLKINFFYFFKFSVYPFCSATGHVKRNLKINFLNFKNFQCTFFSPPLVMPKKFENKFFVFLKFSVYPFFSATGNVKRNLKINFLFF